MIVLVPVGVVVVVDVPVVLEEVGLKGHLGPPTMLSSSASRSIVITVVHGLRICEGRWKSSLCRRAGLGQASGFKS